jgi:glycosyltransferase involved in cell wall biosynthesis
MSSVLLCINLYLLLLALVNLVTIRRPISATFTDKSVLVLLPVRNEEKNIERVIGEIEHQVGVPNLRLLVINDNSEDQTFEIAQSLSSTRTSVIGAPEPHAGWLGKVSALQFGFTSLDYQPDYIVSIDADVRFQPEAMVRAIASIEKFQLDFISPYPRQIALTWGERLAQPLLQWSWMSTLLLRFSEKFPLLSTVVCNGQFLVAKYEALIAIDGFSSVAHKVLDDIELGRSLVKSGFRGTVIDGSQLASTRMYQSFNELRAGYGKSLHTAFGSLFGAIFVALFISVTGVLPFLLALTGNTYAIAALMAIFATRVLSAYASSTRLRDAFLHPLSVALFIYLLHYSWRRRADAQWKGRKV